MGTFTPRPDYATDRAACIAMLKALGLQLGGGGGWHYAYQENRELFHCQGWDRFYRMLGYHYQAQTGQAPPAVRPYTPQAI